MEQEYYEEDVLIDKFQSGEIDFQGYLMHHSPEYREEFISFCRENGLELSNDSALMFIERENDRFDLALEKGEI